MGGVGFPELSHLLPANRNRGADSGGAARSAGPGQRIGPTVGIAGWKARSWNWEHSIEPLSGFGGEDVSGLDGASVFVAQCVEAGG